MTGDTELLSTFCGWNNRHVLTHARTHTHTQRHCIATHGQKSISKHVTSTAVSNCNLCFVHTNP